MQNILEQFNNVISRLDSISADLEEKIKKTNWSQTRKSNAIQIAKKINNCNLTFRQDNYKCLLVLPPIEFIVVPNELLASKYTPSVFMYLNAYITELIADLNILSDVVQFSYSGRISMNQDLNQPWSYKITWKF